MRRRRGGKVHKSKKGGFQSELVRAAPALALTLALMKSRKSKRAAGKRRSSKKKSRKSRKSKGRR